jgi:hypothetical protein
MSNHAETSFMNEVGAQKRRTQLSVDYDSTAAVQSAVQKESNRWHTGVRKQLQSYIFVALIYLDEQADKAWVCQMKL